MLVFSAPRAPSPRRPDCRAARVSASRVASTSVRRFTGLGGLRRFGELVVAVGAVSAFGDVGDLAVHLRPAAFQGFLDRVGVGERRLSARSVGRSKTGRAQQDRPGTPRCSNEWTLQSQSGGRTSPTDPAEFPGVGCATRGPRPATPGHLHRQGPTVPNIFDNITDNTRLGLSTQQ